MNEYEWNISDIVISGAKIVPYQSYVKVPYSNNLLKYFF